MSYRSIRAWAMFTAAWSVCPIAGEAAEEAQRWRGYVHLNGYTHHFAAPGTNDTILGTGLTWHTRNWGRLRTAWEMDIYQDSAWELSAYVGRSWVLPFRLGGIGATGALMYHRNFAPQNSLRLLPVVLPFAETTLARGVKVRAYYIPPIRSRKDEQFAIQLLIPFWR